MQTVSLLEQEWQRVLSLIGTKNLWVDCNDLLMKIGAQLAQQQTNTKQQTNSQEVPGNSGEVVTSRAN